MGVGREGLVGMRYKDRRREKREGKAVKHLHAHRRHAAAAACCDEQVPKRIGSAEDRQELAVPCRRGREGCNRHALQGQARTAYSRGRQGRQAWPLVDGMLRLQLAVAQNSMKALGAAGN